jgi:acetylornithine deacetylase/succinyl-diaminopimelate desuccinylase-like protein
VNDPSRKEVTTLLQDLIRFDTTNPPGNETPAADYLKHLFDREKIPCEVVESQHGRGNFLATMRGDEPGPTLMFLSHLDVVPATRVESWKHPPFSGALDEGWIYGRGAVDTKFLTAAEAMAMILLKRSGAKLKGTLKLAAVADEEQGGVHGADWLIKNHPGKVKADYVINEGAGVVFKTPKGPLYFVDTEEKGICWVKVTAKGKAAHASAPEMGDSAVAKMARVLTRVSEHRTKARPSEVLKKELMTGLETAYGPQGLTLAQQLLNPQTSDTAMEMVKKIEPTLAPGIDALLRMSIAETMVKGGVKENVIPDYCEAIIDCRLPLGMDREEALAELKAAAGDVSEIQFEAIQYTPASTSSVDTKFYGLVTEALEETVGTDALAIPSVLTGSSDSRYFREMGALAYGFAVMSPDIDYRTVEFGVHGVDEKINVSSLYTCTDFLVRLCRKVLA